MRLNRWWTRLFTLVAIIPLPAAAFGQALADRVPADTIIYAGYTGVESPGPGYQNSNLKGVLAESQIPQFVQQFLPAVMDRLAKEDPDVAHAVAILRAVGGPMWRHPSAFFFAGVELSNPNLPMPRLGLLCQAGTDAADLQKQLEDLLKQVGDLPVPVRVAHVGDLVAITVGYGKAEDALAGGANGTKGLSADGDFNKALAQVSKDGVLTAYINFDRLVSTVDQVMAKVAPPEAQQAWAKGKETTGIQGLKAIVFSEGFEGKEWGTRLFVSAPEPRQGFLKSFMAGGKGLSNDIYKTIPQNATMAGAMVFDVSGLLDLFRTLAGQIDATVPKQIDDGLKEVSQAVGVDIQKDFLGSFGSEWAYYVDPTVIGKGLLGITVVNRLKNPANAEQSFTRIEDFANKLLAQQLPPPFKAVAFQQTTVGALKVHYLATPLITPAWTIQNGTLYMGLYPQTAVAAAAQGASNGKSILDNPAFVALRDRLGATKPDSIQFMDLPRLAPDNYTTWVAVSRLAGVGDLFGIQSPPMLMPALSKLMPYLSPAGQVVWIDAAGAHLRAISPFPGSEALGSDPASMSVAQEAVLMGVMLPALNKSREQANRVKSASNLRQIGLGGFMFANAKKDGSLPPDLGELVKEMDLSVEVFINPRSSNEIPPDIRAASKEKQAAWVKDNSDYLWFGAGKNNHMGSEELMGAEKPQGLQDGINILFGDGHVEFINMSRAMELLQKVQK